MIDTENPDGTDHWQTLKNPKEPLVVEGIRVSSTSKFDNAKDTTDLSS
jgi:hypothetical protein